MSTFFPYSHIIGSIAKKITPAAAFFSGWRNYEEDQKNTMTDDNVISELYY